MKNVLRCVFTVIGTIVGAGFLSGRELVCFFGTKRFLPLVAVTAFLFALFFYFLLGLGYRRGGFAGALAFYPRAGVACYRVCLFFSSLILTAGMAAGAAGLNPRFFLIGVLALAAAFLLCGRGLSALSSLNFFLVPVLLASVLAAALAGGTALPQEEESPLKLYAALSYAGLNVFLSSPVLCDLGKDMKRGKGVAAVLAAVLLFCFMLLILSALCQKGGAKGEIFPLLSLFPSRLFFSVLLCAGTFTSLCSSSYTLFRMTEGRKRKNAARTVLFLAAAALSFLGFSRIVEAVYPVLGAAGFALLVAAAMYDALFRQGD